MPPAQHPSSSYRGRLAPSPTGRLHLGHARTFWVAWHRARARKGILVFRNEDLDPDRSRPEFLAGIIRDLRWLGITWDEGPDHGAIWHVADRGEATWLELAREACRLQGVDVRVDGVSTEAWGAAAPRPAYSVLDLTGTESVLGRPMMPWREALRLHLEDRAKEREAA